MNFFNNIKTDTPVNAMFFTSEISIIIEQQKTLTK